MTDHYLVELLTSLGPLLLFIVALVVIYIRGTRINRQLLGELESSIKKSLDEHTTEIRKVQIRADEYEFRCKTKNKDIRILTFHLKMANRSFIVQWLINKVFGENERVFMGVKIGGGEYGDDDPQYKFDVVPYHRKSFIKQRHETFVQYNDIPTASKKIDQSFMIKSESSAYVQQFVNNPEFLRLLHALEPYIEHLGIQKATEDTDPHISLTYEFNARENNPVDDASKLFFTVVNQHLQNHDEVKKLVAKGVKGNSRSRRRGRAKRGGATGRRK